MSQLEKVYGSGQHTLLSGVKFRLADAFYVYLFCFTQLATVFALSYGATFLFNFKERTVGVFARRGSVTLYTGLTGGGNEQLIVGGRQRRTKHIFLS